MLDLPHNSIETGGGKGRRELNGGRNTNAGRSTVAMQARGAGRIGGGCFRMQRKGSEIQDPGGEPRGFIGGDGREKGNRPPRSPGLPRTPPRHVAGHARAVPILSSQKISADGPPSPSESGLSTHRGSTSHKGPFLFSLAHLGPSNSPAGPTKKESTNNPPPRAEAPVRTAPNQSPVNGTPRPTRKNTQLMKN